MFNDTEVIASKLVTLELVASYTVSTSNITIICEEMSKATYFCKLWVNIWKILHNNEVNNQA